jgi:hypothetical protein
MNDAMLFAQGLSTRSAKWSRVLLGLSIVSMTLATWLIATPAWNAGSDAEAEATRLAGRIAARDRLEHEYQDRSKAFSVLQVRGAALLRTIPQDPAQAQLMRALSEPVDGVLVFSQTIAAGKSVAAAREGPKSWRAVPVTVAMKADFATCLRMLQRAEQSDRLVRTLELDFKRDPTDASGVIDASIVVDAVWNDDALDAPSIGGAP